MPRIILHCDLNNFYASVECLRDPALKNMPLIVAGDPENRHGVVLAKNDIAKAAGIKTGDTVWEARQKIPGLVAVKPQFDRYMHFSKKAKEIYNRYTPLVEPFGADECWLDYTGCEEQEVRKNEELGIRNTDVVSASASSRPAEQERRMNGVVREQKPESTQPIVGADALIGSHLTNNVRPGGPHGSAAPTGNSVNYPSDIPHSSLLISHSISSAASFAYAKEAADEIRAALKNELGLTASVGVSFNKIFAKLGSDLKKPDATTVISPENFKSVVWPLPVGELFMVGRKTAEKLIKCNIRNIGDLATADETVLKEKFGIVGVKLKNAAAGFDDEPVREAVSSHQNKSYGHGMTAKRDICDLADLSALVYYLSDRIAARLRHGDVRGFGIAIDLRSNELRHVAKQCTLPEAVCSSNEIAAAATDLAKTLWNGSPPLRTVTVSVFDLIHGGFGQASMFDTSLGGKKKADSLDLAVEKIRRKYGATSILRADLIERDFIYDKTDDEDFLPFQR